MRAFERGAQWAHSHDTHSTHVTTSRPRATKPRSLRGRIAVGLVGLIVLTLSVAIPPTPAAAASTYLLMPRAELLGLPASGAAWTDLKSVADGSLGTPDLCDQEAQHHLKTFASALVYARTGTAAYGTKARQGVMAAIRTQVPGCNNATLALGRQLMAYVLAADLADLSGTDDSTFRSWLSTIRTKDIGGHSVWKSLTLTHTLSAANWGAHAGASRIAASLYLGDSADVAAAAKVTQGFLGNRSAYAGFAHKLDGDDLSWTCSGSQSTYTPENPACTKSGINLDGAFVTDVSRGGSLRWPPADPGINYQLESIQGMGMQVELLYRNGYSGAWGWSGSALKRAAGVVTRSGASGGTGWNETTASRQMPWLLNLRYRTTIPTRVNALGRSIGFTSWLYGGGATSSTPVPTTPVAGPTVTKPYLRVAKTATVPKTGVRARVSWSLASSANGVRRYDLQVKRDGGAYRALTLSSSTAKSRWVTLATSSVYRFRVRAVDRSGRVGPWNELGANRAVRYSDGSARISWKGTWRVTRSTSYIGGKVHYTRSRGATATIPFSGTSIAWIGPKGPTRGKAKVYLDGVYVATVDLYAASFKARRAVFARSVPNGNHTLTIKALRTSGRPIVAIDAFTVIRPS